MGTIRRLTQASVLMWKPRQAEVSKLTLKRNTDTVQQYFSFYKKNNANTSLNSDYKKVMLIKPYKLRKKS